MGYRFPSEEWTAELCRQINSSPAYASAASKWEGDIVLIVEDSAGIYLDLWHGECREVEYLIDPQSHSAEFAISAGLDDWKRVLNGSLDPIQGMMTRHLKLNGNLVKIIRHVKAAQELVKCAARIDTEFP